MSARTLIFVLRALQNQLQIQILHKILIYFKKKFIKNASYFAILQHFSVPVLVACTLSNVSFKLVVYHTPVGTRWGHHHSGKWERVLSPGSGQRPGCYPLGRDRILGDVPTPSPQGGGKPLIWMTHNAWNPFTHFRKFCLEKNFWKCSKSLNYWKKKVFQKIAFFGAISEKVFTRSARPQAEKWCKIVKSNAFLIIFLT